MSILGWLKGLSVAGKLVAGTIVTGSVITVGVIATQPSQTPPREPTGPTTEIETETETETKTEVIPFETVTRNDSTLLEGTTQVITEGQNGVRTIVYTITLTDGKETSRAESSNAITMQPITKIIANGTKKKPACDSNYSGYCVPIVSYDLDCVDIGYNTVYVRSYDPHGFDGDNDGYGCE